MDAFYYCRLYGRTLNCHPFLFGEINVRNRFALQLVLLLSLTMPAIAQVKAEDPQKTENIKQLLTLTGADKLRNALMDQMLDAFKKNLPAVDQDPKNRKALDRLMELLREEIKKADFTNMTIELYEKYFTADEIKGLIQFYSSPVGQKAIQVLPTLMQESTGRGIEMGQAAAERAFARWGEEYPEMKKALAAGGR
jgi:uncharacterized protein